MPEPTTELPKVAQLQVNHDEIHLIIGMFNVKVCASQGDFVGAWEQAVIVDDAIDSLGVEGMNRFGEKLLKLHRGLCK